VAQETGTSIPAPAGRGVDNSYLLPADVLEWIASAGVAKWAAAREHVCTLFFLFFLSGFDSFGFFFFDFCRFVVLLVFF
jgi:hypothetical protein